MQLHCPTCDAQRTVRSGPVRASDRRSLPDAVASPDSGMFVRRRICATCAHEWLSVELSLDALSGSLPAEDAGAADRFGPVLRWLAAPDVVWPVLPLLLPSEGDPSLAGQGSSLLDAWASLESQASHDDADAGAQLRGGFLRALRACRAFGALSHVHAIELIPAQRLAPAERLDLLRALHGLEIHSAADDSSVRLVDWLVPWADPEVFVDELLVGLQSVDDDLPPVLHLLAMLLARIARQHGALDSALCAVVPAGSPERIVPDAWRDLAHADLVSILPVLSGLVASHAEIGSTRDSASERPDPASASDVDDLAPPPGGSALASDPDAAPEALLG